MTALFFFMRAYYNVFSFQSNWETIRTHKYRKRGKYITGKCKKSELLIIVIMFFRFFDPSFCIWFGRHPVASPHLLHLALLNPASLCPSAWPNSQRAHPSKGRQRSLSLFSQTTAISDIPTPSPAACPPSPVHHREPPTGPWLQNHRAFSPQVGACNVVGFWNNKISV